MVEGRPVFWNGKETQYFLFKNGDLYNENTHRISQGSINHGYIRYNLEIDGKTTSVFKHRLLAEMFIENLNPNEKTVVNHINGCTQDNRLENLEWCSQRENSQKRVNPIEHKILTSLSEEELEQEIWRDFRDTKYQVSNMGRIKNTETGYITFGSPNKNSGYIRWTYSQRDGIRKEIQAHRAVYEVFHPNEEINVINHIDSNRGNNRLSNLENITQQENVIKSYYQTNTKTTVLTGQYDLNGNLIAVYPSTAEAARAMGLKNGSNISRAMKTNWKSHGYYWRQLTQQQYEDFKKKECEVS